MKVDPKFMDKQHRVNLLVTRFTLAIAQSMDESPNGLDYAVIIAAAAEVIRRAVKEEMKGE